MVHLYCHPPFIFRPGMHLINFTLLRSNHSARCDRGTLQSVYGEELMQSLGTHTHTQTTWTSGLAPGDRDLQASIFFPCPVFIARSGPGEQAHLARAVTVL